MTSPIRVSGLAVALFAVTVACGASSLPDGPAIDCGTTGTACGDRCVDLSVDPANCGACGVACKSTELCSRGHCGVGCFGGTTRCGDSCVDVRYDPANCGSCGKACGAGSPCLGGACVDRCPAPRVLCGHTCIDVISDDGNCGTCGVKCGTGKKCNAGTCSCPGALCDGACTDTQTNPLHCGGCGIGCIPVVESCSAGKCVCAKGLTSCGGDCVDIGSSPKNCGGCGTTCAPGQLCTDGQCGSPTTNWPTQGANVFRTGELVGEIGRPPLTRAWSAKLLSAGTAQPVAVGANHVFVTFENYNNPANAIYSLDLADGSVQWTRPAGTLARTGYPTYANGRVLLVNGSGGGNPPRTTALDGATGNAVWTSNITAQFEQYWSPLVVGGKVYTDGGTFGGLYAFDEATGSQLFFNNALEQYDQWSATWSGSSVLTFLAGNLRAHDPSSGSILWTTPVPWQFSGYSMRSFPVVANGKVFVVAPPKLHAIDLATHTIVWSASNSYTAAPAVAGGILFAIDSGTLTALDAATGQFQWTFIGDGKLEFAPIVANGHVYVASRQNAYAVEIATQTQVWTAAVGGPLSIASRRLLIATTDAVHAYVMSK